MTKAIALAVAGVAWAAVASTAVAIEPATDLGAPVEQIQKPLARQAGEQQAKGSVLDIDRNSGLLTVASPAGTLKLHFPPQSLHDVEKGDMLIVQYALAKAESLRAYDAPASNPGEHSMAGTVTDVDPDTGWVHVKSEHTTLQLAFPPEAVRDLRTGDRVNVNLTFFRGA